MMYTCVIASLLSTFLVQSTAAQPEVTMDEWKAADALLSAYEDLVKQVDDMTDAVKLIARHAINLAEKHGQVLEATSETEDLLRRLNLKQLAGLSKILEEIESQELRRRELESASDLSPIILQEFDVGTVLQSSEKEIEAWLVSLMEQKSQEMLKPLKEAPSVGGSSGCTSMGEAVQEVHQALVKYSQDGIGQYDHAQHGNIVHHLTSNTYQTPYHPTIGDSWSRRLIPEDWESFLPSGWEDWNPIPSFLAHTFGAKSSSAPPETILHPSTLPGSCWPMDGDSGRVVIRLAYPVQVTAISIDHASKLLLPKTKDALASAPKGIKVYGYRPCDDDCPFGFVLERKELLVDAEYDVDLGGVQTFQVKSATEEEELDDGTCSPTSCSNGDNSSFAAIELEIEDNHGADYTCLYRLRVHGSA